MSLLNRKDSIFLDFQNLFRKTLTQPIAQLKQTTSRTTMTSILRPPDSALVAVESTAILPPFEYTHLGLSVMYIVVKMEAVGR